MIVLQAAPDMFYAIGSGLAVQFARNPDTDDRIAGIASIEEGSYSDGRWAAKRRLNGDQSNQGRELLMDSPGFHVTR